MQNTVSSIELIWQLGNQYFVCKIVKKRFFHLQDCNDCLELDNFDRKLEDKSLAKIPEQCHNFSLWKRIFYVHF